MGAWATIYQKGDEAAAGSAEAYGILAVKAELAYNGATGLNLAKTSIGGAADRAIRAFQKGHGLTVDGEVGPQTAHALFHRRVEALEQANGIAGDVLCKIAALESDWDPAAVGVADPGDLGIVQIHMPAHPAITTAEAFTPAWALEWAASGLKSAWGKLGDWDAVIASWNVGGGGAQYWLEHGKPASLFVWWFTGPDGAEIDLGARATTYLRLVLAQSC